MGGESVAASDVPWASCDTCDMKSIRSCSPKESWWTHKNTVFGEFLFLVPGDSGIVYATKGTDPAIAGANSPTGPMGILDIGAEPGFRVGGSVALTDQSSAFLTFTWWEGKDEDRITATGLNVLNPHLLHPSTLTVAGAGLEATGRQDLGFQLIDAGFRRAFITNCNSAVNWIAGVRYAHLDQAVTTSQVASVPTGLTTLRSDVDFHGFGLLAGLDAERRCAPLGISIYGSTLGSLTGGNWNARSRQTNQFGGGVIASDFEEFRIMPVIEAEVGLAWQSSKNRVRAQIGFMASGWLNAISSAEYLDGLNRNNFNGLSETLTFSGLTSSLEFRF
ncbi:MAG TPA: hypothetical protein DDZ51_27165 [Planctomycetaceae bacterium]|nr:hypothetical protein [Planctomycetaceae bacterium]